MLLFMGLLARYVKSAGVSKLARDAIKKPSAMAGKSVMAQLSKVLGMAPYLASSARPGWLRDLAGTMPDVMYPFWIPENFGIVFVLLTYFLLIRFRLEDAGDRVLQSWFLAAIALALIPQFTMSSHLFNGFAYCVGFLLGRRLAGDRKLLPVIARHRRGVTWAVAAGAAFTALSLFVLYQQIWNDGRRAEPEWMLSAVRLVSERPFFEWLRFVH